jgi:hypothetical protein
MAKVSSSSYPATVEEAMKSRSELPPIVRVHDVFNLVALGSLIALNVAFIACGSSSETMVARALLWASLGYFLVCDQACHRLARLHARNFSACLVVTQRHAG